MEHYQCGLAPACVEGLDMEATRDAPCGNRHLGYDGMRCYEKTPFQLLNLVIGTKCAMFHNTPLECGALSNSRSWKARLLLLCTQPSPVIAALQGPLLLNNSGYALHVQ